MEKREEKNRAWNCILLLFRLMTPIIILICGVTIFISQVSGWNLILGLPLTISGVILTIYTYDEILQAKFGNYPDRSKDEEQNY